MLGQTDFVEPRVSGLPELEILVVTPARCLQLADQIAQKLHACKGPFSAGRARDGRDFARLVSGASAEPAQPATVALYLTDRADTLKTSSLSRRLTAISRRHQALGFPSPAAMQHAHVSEVWKGIQRTKGTAQEGKRPLLTADLRRMLEELPESLQGMRDRALLLVGFAGGFRRSELPALEVTDLARKSSTD